MQPRRAPTRPAAAEMAGRSLLRPGHRRAARHQGDEAAPVAGEIDLDSSTLARGIGTAAERSARSPTEAP